MSQFNLVITKSAAKDISKLDRVIQKRLEKKLRLYLKQDNPLVSAGRLAGPKLAGWRWRIGDYRILFDVHGEDIVILSVRHRREVYKK